MRRIKAFFFRYRRPFVIAAHLSLIILSNFLAFWLRYEDEIPYKALEIMLYAWPWLLSIRAFFFAVFRLYQGLWRYTSVWDLKNICLGVLFSTLVFVIVIRFLQGEIRYPRSVFIIDSLLLISFLSAIRLPRRIHREMQRSRKGKRILIYGAGDAGEMILRDIKNNPVYNYLPVGFIDDNASKIGQCIHGVQVLGGREEVSRIVEKEKPDEVLIAIPSAEPAAIRQILKTLDRFKLPISTLPNLRDILDGKVTLSQIRNLSVGDLLSRIPADLDTSRLEEVFQGKVVMVTGAGGSIGSEISRQIARLQPESLILLDRYENGLYQIANELAALRGSFPVKAIIGDVTDENRVKQVCGENRPQVIFHAAAHKHVPLMERNPCEAVKNNVAGTRIMIEAADRHGVEKFIFISTDKAVNPSSVMGATKRLCELLIRTMGDKSRTTFTAVRFGNVLGSNGSIVPLVLDQIKKGGPVTVTHPDMCRYFMLIPEAVQLVLHAARFGKAGEIYILQMGEPIHVLEMVRNLIRLAGRVPDEEIPIVFTGLRSGEKLYEQLVGADEAVEPSSIDGILRVSTLGTAGCPCLDEVIELEEAANQGESQTVMAALQQLIPTFCPIEPNAISSSDEFCDTEIFLN